MTLVTITGNAWDSNRAPIPAANQPELWFRPLTTAIGSGLFTGREVKATLSSSGAFTVQVESFPGVLYVPFMRWLVDPAVTDPERRSYGYTEWQAIYPGNGGPISELPPFAQINGVLYGWGPPPEYLDNVSYQDITGPKVRYWGPKGGNV